VKFSSLSGQDDPEKKGNEDFAGGSLKKRRKSKESVRSALIECEKKGEGDAKKTISFLVGRDHLSPTGEGGEKRKLRKRNKRPFCFSKNSQAIGAGGRIRKDLRVWDIGLTTGRS